MQNKEVSIWREPSSFAENYLRIYADDVKNLSLVQILEGFYIYIGCSNQFAVKDYFRVVNK